MELQIPEYAANLMKKLEQAGYQAWAVGGCVRDSLLGLTPHDWDLCTSALPEQTAAVFSDLPLIRNGEKHGTIAVCTEGQVVEITTLRSEGSYTDGRHPDWVKFVPDLRQDLARRDFTVNAIAWSPRRGYADPFGGWEDLKNKLLRCVGQPHRRFEEDALRLLRGIRFAARFRLAVEEQTLRAMVDSAQLVQRLSGERVFTELNGFLGAADFDDLIRFAPVLTAAIPELAPAVGFDQHSPHHAYDVYTHICHVTAAVPAQPVQLRWAAFLHDVGKPACFTRDETGRGHFKEHAQVGAQMAQDILTRLHAPKGLREDVVWLVSHHMTPLENDEKQLRRYLSRYGCPRLLYLIALQRADMASKGICDEDAAARLDAVKETVLRLNLAESRLTVPALAVDGNDMKALGYSGPQIGQILKQLLEKVLDGSLENRRESLLDEAKKQREEAQKCLTTPTKP